MIAELVEWADQAAEPQRVVPARVLAAVEAAGTGDADAVLGHVWAGLAILEGRFDAFIAELAVGAGRALHRLGSAAEARRFADELSPALRREAQTGSTIGLDVVEGLALLGEGRPREAAGHLQRARDLEAERGAMYFAVTRTSPRRSKLPVTRRRRKPPESVPTRCWDRWASFGRSERSPL
jgi:hypothetical protein